MFQLASPIPACLRRISLRVPATRVPQTGPTIYRTAQSYADLSRAFQLLQSQYLQAGLTSQRGRGYRVQSHHLWDQTQVFTAVRGRAVIGTVTLIGGEPCGGLPIESKLPDAITRIREQGGKVGEIASFAIANRDASGRSIGRVGHFRELTRLMIHFARHQQFTDLVAIVHPRHARVYQTMFGFTKLGDISKVPEVEGQPGTVIRIRIQERSVVNPRWELVYFGGRYTSEELRPHPMSPVNRKRFERFLTLPPPQSPRARQNIATSNANTSIAQTPIGTATQTNNGFQGMERRR